MTVETNVAGNVFEPRALNELFPTWKELGAPLDTPVTEDAFVILTSDQKAVRLPNALLPPQQASGIGRRCRWGYH